MRGLGAGTTRVRVWRGRTKMRRRMGEMKIRRMKAKGECAERLLP